MQRLFNLGGLFGSRMQLRHWYFAFNDPGIVHFERSIRVAVETAKRNTWLIPICLYSGKGHPFIAELQRRGVRVISHTSSLINAINATPNANGWAKEIATGANLRLDIPLIEETERFVLYTDCDVMFLRHPRLEPMPEFFACAPEGNPDDWSFANTGAMIINVPNMRREHAALMEFAAPRLNTFGPLHRGTYDQGILNAYFENRWDRLPLGMNWKPYWGLNPDATIIHFHGPKPQFLEALAEGRDEHVPQVYKNMYQKSREAFDAYLETFKRIEQRISRRH